MELEVTGSSETIADRLTQQAVDLAVINIESKAITEWEKGFIYSVRNVRRRSDLTQDQWNTLTEICTKLRKI